MGKALTLSALDQAGQLGIVRVFVLTYEQRFFERLGFGLIDKDQLPQKVWRDCVKCPLQHDCKEIAMITDIDL